MRKLKLNIPKWVVIATVIGLGLGVLFSSQIRATLGDVWAVTGWRVLSTGHLVPETDATYNIGSDTARVSDIFAQDYHLSKEDPVTYGPRIYQRVYNHSGISLGNGHIVTWYTASTTTVGGYMVDIATTVTQADGTVAGVMAEAVANGAYGDMQIWGYHPSIAYNELGTTAGYDIITSTRAGFAYGSTTDKSGIGIWLETNAASSSTGTAKGFLRF